MSITHDEMTLDEQIKVMQDFRYGKDVQYYSDILKEWVAAPNPGRCFPEARYRTKAEPTPLTFSEAIKFIRGNPSYEIQRFANNAIRLFSSIGYSERKEMIEGEKIKDLRWREGPGKEWKEFVK